MSQYSSHVETFAVDQVDKPHIRIKNSLQQDPALHALDGDLPCHLFDGNVVHHLYEVVGVQRVDFIISGLLVREEPSSVLLLQLLPLEGALDALLLNYLDDVVEPLGQQHCVLPRRRFAQVLAASQVGKVGRLVHPGRKVFVAVFRLRRYARADQLIAMVCERLQQLALIDVPFFARISCHRTVLRQQVLLSHAHGTGNG